MNNTLRNKNVKHTHLLNILLQTINLTGLGVLKLAKNNGSLKIFPEDRGTVCLKSIFLVFSEGAGIVQIFYKVRTWLAWRVMQVISVLLLLKTQRSIYICKQEDKFPHQQFLML